MRHRLRLPDFSLYKAGLLLLLATGWLLPNHYKPWNTFHSTAWIAGALLLIGCRVLATAKGPLRLPPTALFLLAVSLVPWLHHLLGLLPLTSDALLNSVYLVGVAFAYAAGSQWARTSPDEPFDLLLGAAAAAAIVQVGIQMYQWMGYAQVMDLVDIWIVPHAGSRPYGNLSQPNQLASLLLLGVAGTAWAWVRQAMRTPFAIVLAGVLLLGVALTESRTALVSLTLATVVASVAPASRITTRTRRTVQLFYVFYLAAFFGLGALGQALRAGDDMTLFGRETTVTRPVLFRMAIDAANARPWLGWGWNKTNEGYLHVYPNHPALADAYVEQSHNLALDLLVWNGWPLGLLLIGASLWWLWTSVRSAANPRQVLGLCGLGALLMHAMLELPLHHGYFLWPFAMLAGAVAAHWESRGPALAVPRRFAAACLAALSVVTGVLVYDYLVVEETFRELRFQLQRIGSGHDETPPDTLLLRDWRDFIVMMRERPTRGMPDETIDNWRDLLLYNTAPLPMRKLIGALEYNGRHEEALYWSARACALLAPPKCKHMLDEWPLDKAPASAPMVLDDAALERPKPVSGLVR